MTARTTVRDLKIANELYHFVNQEVLPDLGVAPAAFWEPPSLADSSGLLPFLRKKSNTAEPFTGVVG